MDSPKTSLTPELLEKARLELKEDWTRVPKQIKSLRERILEDQKRNFRTDDAFLLRFLRARKFDEDRTLELMINYYKQRDKNPQFFRKTLPDLEKAMSSKYQGFMPNIRAKNGSAIVVFNTMTHWNTSDFSMEDIFSLQTQSLERIIEHEDVQVCGITCLVDTKGLTAKHMINTNPFLIRRIVGCLVNSFPIRYKGLHFVNEPILLDAFFAIIKPFLGKKLLSRIHFHGGNFDNLFNDISVSALPEEFGGKAGPYDNAEWNQILREHRPIVEKNLKFGFIS